MSNKFEDTDFKNTRETSAFQMVGSSLFHLIVADGKKVFLKKICLVLIREIQPAFLVG